MKNFFDAIIVGGGPSGAVAALVLARHGHKVILVDPLEIPVRKVGESLPSAARPVLKHLGLLSLMEGGSHKVSYGNMSAWGSHEILTTDFIRDPNGPGWHLDRSKFDADLREAAIKSFAQFSKARVTDLSHDESGWSAKLGSENVRAKFLVDATGRSSLIAKRLGATRRRDDDLMAIVAWVKTSEKDADSRTLIESAPHGWWYTAKIPGENRVLVYHTNAGKVNEVLRNKEYWKQFINETVHIKTILKDATLIGDLKCVEACGSRLDVFAGEDWLATGDAALSFDPLSSQGMFNALYSGMKAGDSIVRALKGDVTAVDHYSDGLERIRSVYVTRKHFYYCAETRWLDHAFWKTRIFKDGSHKIA